MAIGLKIISTLRIAPRHQSTARSLTTWMNSNTVWLKIILCDACTVREIFRPLIRRHQQYIRILVQQDCDTSSVNAMSSSVYVNSNVYGTIHVNSTVHVNSVIFPFMLLLRFSIVLSSKVMSVSSSDLSFIVK